MNRPDISRLNKNRSIFLKVGFITALSLTIMAFNYTVYEDTSDYQAPVMMEEDELLAVARTIHEKKRLPPPPVVEPTDNYIIEDEPIFDPELEPEPVDPVIVPDPQPIEPRPRPIVKSVPKPPIVEPDEPETEIAPIFIAVEQMPRFSGCEDQGLSDPELKMCSDKKMLNYIYSNIKYPRIASENYIEGTVVVSFVVETDGSISGLKIARDIGGGCGKEVIRIVKNMPEWIAGEQQGRKVRVQFNLPVKFELD